MRYVLTILSRTLPPAFVLFLFVDLIVNPNIPRLGTVAAGTSANGQLSPKDSLALLDTAKQLIAAHKDEEALVPMRKLAEAYPENYNYNRTLAELHQRL